MDKFREKGYLDFNELFGKQCSFVNSHETFEIRIADIVNTILARYYNNKGSYEAYRLIRQCFLHHGRITQLVLNDFNLAEWRYDPTKGPFGKDTPP